MRHVVPELVPDAFLVLGVGAPVVDHHVAHRPASAAQLVGDNPSLPEEVAAAVAGPCYRRQLQAPPGAGGSSPYPTPRGLSPDARLEERYVEMHQLVKCAILGVQLVELSRHVALRRDRLAGRRQPRVRDANVLRARRVLAQASGQVRSGQVRSVQGGAARSGRAGQPSRGWAGLAPRGDWLARGGLLAGDASPVGPGCTL